MRVFKINDLDVKPIGVFVCRQETYFQISPYVLNLFYDYKDFF